jgi:ArsR family transcriptional regulator
MKRGGMRNLVKIFKALSDPQRIRILKMLEVRPLCVCEISEILKLANSTVSKHLSLLRDVDFILDKKEGKWVNYSLNPENKNFVNKLQPLIEDSLKKDKTVKDDIGRIKSIDRHHICNIRK